MSIAKIERPHRQPATTGGACFSAIKNDRGNYHTPVFLQSDLSRRLSCVLWVGCRLGPACVRRPTIPAGLPSGEPLTIYIAGARSAQRARNIDTRDCCRRRILPFELDHPHTSFYGFSPKLLARTYDNPLQCRKTYGNLMDESCARRAQNSYPGCKILWERRCPCDEPSLM